MLALAGADPQDPEAFAGATLLVEFLFGFRGLLRGLSEKPKSTMSAASTRSRIRR